MIDLRNLRDLDPFATYREMAHDGAVQWAEGMNAWVVTGYRECARIAQNEARFETPWPHANGGAEVLGRYGMYILRGAEHRTVHSALHRWFEANSGDESRMMVRRHFDDLVDSLAHPQRFEFFGAIAEPLPGRVILDVMGLPVTDELRTELVRLNEHLHDWFAAFGDDPDILERCLQAIREAEDLMLPTIRSRRDHPTGDLLSALWHIGRSSFGDWDERDVAKYATFFFGAGTVNSTNLASSVVHTLVADADLRRRLIDDDALVAPVIEDILRLWSPVQLRTRRAAEDVEVGGREIREGDRVHPIVGAANRDPVQFEAPDELDPDRARLKTHLGFYLGARYCAGAPLARLETAEIARSFLRRFPDAMLDPAFEPPTFAGFAYRGFRPLHLISDAQARR